MIFRLDEEEISREMLLAADVFERDRDLPCTHKLLVQGSNVVPDQAKPTSRHVLCTTKMLA
jgi:hypothetical protein